MRIAALSLITVAVSALAQEDPAACRVWRQLDAIQPSKKVFRIDLTAPQPMGLVQPAIRHKSSSLT
jgi:hypothetical protein